MFSSPMQLHSTTTCSSLALCTFLLALIGNGAAAPDSSNSDGESDGGKLMLRLSPANHAIATRSNFLRFGKRSSPMAMANLESAPGLDEDGLDDGDVNEAFEGPIRRDYREFVRFGKRGGQQMASSDKRGQDYLRFGKKADYLRFGKRADYLRFGKRNYDDYEDVEAEEEDLAKRHALWKRFSRLQRSNDFLRFG